MSALVQAFSGVVERIPGGVESRFNMGDGLGAALDALVDKERSGCETLEVTVEEEACPCPSRDLAPSQSTYRVPSRSRAIATMRAA